MKLKIALRWLLAAMMTMAGVMHFVDPARYVRIMPPFFPAPEALVYLSGVLEFLGGLGLLIRRTRRLAAWGLVALLIAVFPANIYMAIHQIPFGDTPTPIFFLWFRLPLQFVLIAWAYWNTKEP